MALVWVSCTGECGNDTRVKSEDIRLDHVMGAFTYTYSYTCPECGSYCTQYANDQVIDILVTVGVRLYNWKYPDLTEGAELGEITDDYCIDFHNALESVSTIDELFKV